jgi:hypothetical protein
MADKIDWNLDYAPASSLEPIQPVAQEEEVIDWDVPALEPLAPQEEQAQPIQQQPLDAYDTFRQQQQDSPQLFPTGQDHVAREVLGLKPKPHQRSEILPESHFGILGDIGSGIADSFLRVGEMTLQAARAYDPVGGVDAVRDITTAGIERIRGWEDEYPRIFKPSAETQDSYFRRSVNSALVNFMPSAYAGLAGGALGLMIGGPIGAVVGFGLGAGLLFGSAEYDSFMEEADANGIPRDQVFGEALTSAFVEGGGEMVADIVALIAFGPTGGLSITAKGALKELMKTPVRQLAKNYVKAAPVEAITEMIQGASQVHLRNESGMDAGSPWQAAIDAIGPALIMTALFGAAGGGKQALHLRQMRKALSNGNVDPAKRQNAADFIEKQIKDKDFAELWKFNAKQYIDQGFDIPIDQPMSDFLAWGESSQWSPELAEDIAEGKDIKLLPEGQGFVLVGESYNPDDLAEYEQYSPEQAEALLNAKETKLLPNGQGFTVGAGEDQYSVYSPELAKKLKQEKEKAQKQLEAPDRRAEKGPPIIPIPEVEAAARGVEAAIETGTTEDIAQAQRRLERRTVEQARLPDRVPALVRRTLASNPQATIGEVYRSVKAKDKSANRQDVAKMVRQERKLDFPTTKKGLKAELETLGQEDFNHFYNPSNLESRLVKALTDTGVSRDDAKAQVRPALESYAKNYEAVNKEALAEREKARAAEEVKKAEKPKEAAEGVKKLKAKPKAQKKKSQAKQAKKPTLVSKKKDVKPTKKKAKAAESIAALDDRPTKKVTPIVPDTTADQEGCYLSG